MLEAGIVLQNVSKIYRSHNGDRCTLEDINLSIRPGEYVGLMGMNGSGKSTLARLCNGLLLPTAGKVYVDGLDTSQAENLPAIRQRVGMVFQNPDNQLICPVVEEEIAFGLENLGLFLPEIRERTAWALEIMGLTGLNYHAPYLLSGGQKQKVALASVLAMKPAYLVLDEPAAMLDPVSRRELLQHLKILNRREGMTIVLCSNEAEDFMDADRLLVIDRGTLCLQGTPPEVLSQGEQLASIGLAQPDFYRLRQQLADAGCPVTAIYNLTDLVDYLCQP
ncbi:MAG TPA: ATP-binding cassette domain-containing protein [Syntrophomonas sp.]|nr:ATP-binding cassette domain-containing protein [Syntrophomonas sp.]